MNQEIMVSVAILTYNQEKYIEQTVLSAINQETDFVYEIVVGDDFSSDKTRDILQMLKNKYPDKIRVILNERNLGVLLNVKSIFDNCKGKYIALLGGDDLFCDTKKIQKQSSFLEGKPDYGAVYSDAKLFFDDGQKIVKVIESAETHYKRQGKEGDIYPDILLSTFILASTIFFRREFYTQYMDFDLYFKLGAKGEHRILLLELSFRSKIGYIKDAMSVYRQMEGTVSRPSSKDKMFALYDSSNSITRYFVNKHGAPKEVKDKLDYNISMFNLLYGYECRVPSRSDEAYAYFKKINKNNFIIKFYYYGAKNTIFWFIIKVLRIFIRPFRLTYFL